MWRKLQGEYGALHALAMTLVYLMPLLLSATRAGADAAIVCIGLLFLVRSALAKDWEWIRSKDVLLLLFFWLYVAADGWLLSSSSNALRATVWIRFIILYIALTQWLLTEPKNILAASKWGTVIMALLLVDTYWQYMFGVSLSGKSYPADNRLGGPMSHPNIGNMLLKTSLPMLGIGWYVAAQSQVKAKKYALALFCLALVALIPLTGERSTSMMLLIALFVLAAIFSFFTPALRKRVMIIGVAFCLLLALLIYTQPIVHMRANYLVAQLGDFKTTPYGQLFIAGWQLFLEHPLFGAGPGEYFALCPAVKTELLLTYCDVHPHNIYLQWLSETGLMGFLLFISAMGTVVCKHIVSVPFKDRNLIPLAFSLAALAILLFPVMVTQSVFSNWPASLFWYSLSLAVCAPRVTKA